MRTRCPMRSQFAAERISRLFVLAQAASADAKRRIAVARDPRQLFLNRLGFPVDDWPGRGLVHVRHRLSAEQVGLHADEAAVDIAL